VTVAVEEIFQAASRAQAEVWVTTSRRTPPGIEAWLERRLRNDPRCTRLVLVGRQGAQGIVGEFLAAASLFVVSGESISMVSEVASSGKPVLAFEPRALWPMPKYRRFLSSLEEEGHARVVRPEELGVWLDRVARGEGAFPPLDDCAHILERLRQWL